jgi:hypothetical protein
VHRKVVAAVEHKQQKYTRREQEEKQKKNRGVWGDKYKELRFVIGQNHTGD